MMLHKLCVLAKASCKANLTLAILAAGLFVAPTIAQDQLPGDREGKVAQLPKLQTRTLRSDGKDVYWEQEVFVPERGARPVVEEVEQTYTVQVPIAVDGKTIYRPETRVRTVTRMKTPGKHFIRKTLVKPSAKFESADGKPITLDELKNRIGMQKFYLVVILHGKQQLAPEYKQLLRKDVVVLRQ